MLHRQIRVFLNLKVLLITRNELKWSPFADVRPAADQSSLLLHMALFRPCFDVLPMVHLCFSYSLVQCAPQSGHIQQVGLVLAAPSYCWHRLILPFWQGPNRRYVPVYQFSMSSCQSACLYIGNAAFVVELFLHCSCNNFRPQHQRHDWVSATVSRVSPLLISVCGPTYLLSYLTSHSAVPLAFLDRRLQSDRWRARDQYRHRSLHHLRLLRGPELACTGRPRTRRCCRTHCSRKLPRWRWCGWQAPHGVKSCIAVLILKQLHHVAATS